VRENGRIVGGEGWQEKVHNREEWKKLLRMTRNITFCMYQWNERMNEKLTSIKFLEDPFIISAVVHIRTEEWMERF